MKGGKHPYAIVKRRLFTEKAQVLQSLEKSQSNRSVARCQSPKVVFVVDPRANKQEIKEAVETIYQSHKVKVTKVNTITIGPKQRRYRGRKGKTSGCKKAVVTFEPGDRLEMDVE